MKGILVYWRYSSYFCFGFKITLQFEKNWDFWALLTFESNVEAEFDYISFWRKNMASKLTFDLAWKYMARKNLKLLRQNIIFQAAKTIISELFRIIGYCLNFKPVKKQLIKYIWKMFHELHKPNFFIINHAQHFWVVQFNNTKINQMSVVSVLKWILDDIVILCTDHATPLFFILVQNTMSHSTKKSS